MGFRALSVATEVNNSHICEYNYTIFSLHKFSSVDIRNAEVLLRQMRYNHGWIIRIFRGCCGVAKVRLLHIRLERVRKITKI